RNPNDHGELTEIHCGGAFAWAPTAEHRELIAADLRPPRSPDESRGTPNLPSSDGSRPANLGILKLQLVDYKCFGAYDRDVANVLADATAYLEHRANGFGKLALRDNASRAILPKDGARRAGLRPYPPYLDRPAVSRVKRVVARSHVRT